MTLLPSSSTSFFSGRGRSDGMNLRFNYDNGIVSTDMTMRKALQGLKNVVHGGMLFGIMDTMMWLAIFMETQRMCMTRKVDIDFFKPVICERPYRAIAKVLRVEDRDVWAEAWVEDGNKERFTQMTGLFRESKVLDIEKVIKNLDFTDVTPEMKDFFLSAIR
jgi:uncharacterized protein (TIGR00369 family)